jgi:hypothetical protein
MALITLLIDPDHLLPSTTTAWHIEQPSEYPALSLALREALHKGEALTVCVRHPTVAIWLERSAACYGSAYVTVRHYSVRDALRERWQVEVPDSIPDELLTLQDLCNLPLRARHGQPFWEMLLEHFFGSLLTTPTFPRGNLALLLNTVREPGWQEGLHHPLAIKALHMKLTSWQHLARRDSEQTLVSWLLSDPEHLRQTFAQYKLLRNYPAHLGQQVLGDAWQTVSRAQEETESLQLFPGDPVLVVPVIEYYLTGIHARMTSSEDLQVLLTQMSGWLQEEFRFLETVLHQHPLWLTPALLHTIEQRFRPLRQTLDQQMAALRRLMAPRFPRAPDQFWTIEEWLSWIQEDYMPYYAWLDANSKHDTRVVTYSGQFDDWYYQHFVQLLHGSPTHFAVNALYQERETIMAEGAVALILMIDNLNLALMQDLVSIFSLHDFALQDGGVRPMLSLIPTTTEVGKARVMAGQGDLENLEAEHYSDLVVKAWSDLAHGKRITYLSNLGAFTSLRERSDDIYFLNYLGIDHALHEDLHESGLIPHEVVYERLVALVKAIESFAHRFRIEHRLAIYVLSDHGSTRLPGETVTVVDKEFVKRATTDAHPRFLALSDDAFATLSPDVKAYCHVISRQRFQTRANYLVARHYARFIETKGACYVHGGLTPEEVVVPFAHFAHREVRPHAPTLHLLMTQFRYEIRSHVRLVLGNPNAFPLEAVRLFLVHAGAEEHLVEHLAPKQEQEIDLETVFWKMPGTSNQQTLTVRLRYECQGHAFGPRDYSFDIIMKPIMEVIDDIIEL